MLHFWSTLFGALTAFIFAIIMKMIENYLAKIGKKDKAQNFLLLLIQEIDAGIKRCEKFIKLDEENPRKESLGRIYTAMWENTQVLIFETIENTLVLHLLCENYRRFDLINFNLDKDRYGGAVGFAKSHIENLKKDFETIKECERTLNY